MQDGEAVRVQLGAAGDYDHFYGSDPNLRGLDTIKPGSAPAHLVLTLDCRDPALESMNLGIRTTFRFVYPYRYDDNLFTYTQVNDQIEFLDPRPAQVTPDWPYSGYPTSFTRVPATLLHARFPAEISDCYPPADPEHPQISIYLGDKQKTTQDHQVNCPQCQHDARLIGRIPDQASGAMEKTWGNAWVFSLFWYCSPCGITVVFNESD